MLALFTFRWYASYLFLYAITCYNIISMCFYYMGKDKTIKLLSIIIYYQKIINDPHHYYHLQRPYKIWWSSLSDAGHLHPTMAPFRSSPGLAMVAKFGTPPVTERVACVVQARWSAWAENGPGWRSRLPGWMSKRNERLFILYLVFVSISFPELSYGSISFHQFSIIVPCSYVYTSVPL